MRATHAALSPLLLVYDDPAAGVRHALESLAEGEPLLSAESGGSTNRLWRITDPDGNRGRARGARRPAARDRRRPSPLRDRARLPRGAGHGGERLDDGRAREHAGRGTDDLPHPPGGRADARARQRLPRHARVGRAGARRWPHSRAWVTSTRPSCSTAAGEAALVEAPGERTLDAAALERLGLEQVTYTPRTDEAVALVDSGRAEGAFLLRPPTIEQVEAVAEAGETMPQKSTYFYPKLFTGLLFHPV